MPPLPTPLVLRPLVSHNFYTDQYVNLSLHALFFFKTNS
jgi:hypothetical protein